MNIIYVTGNFETVQSHILEKTISSGNHMELFFYKERHHPEKVTLPKNIRYYNSKSHLRGPICLLKRLRMAARDLENMVIDNRVDIMHANMCFSDGYICRHIQKKYHIPYVVSVRDTDINLKFLWSLSWLRKQIYLNLVNASGIIFLSSSYMKKMLERIPHEIKELIRTKAVIIPNGIDDYYLENCYYRNTVPKSVRIIFVGKLQRRKNLELTVEAAKILRNKGLDVNITAVGNVEDEYYRTLIDMYDFISYYERCPKEEVINHYRDCDIFVMPSHTETFGLTYVEAMSQGLPVIYTRGQGFDGQFAEGVVGYSVDDYNSEELASRIELIMQEYSTISRSCTDLSKSFSWDIIIRKFLSFYSDCICRR